MTRWLDDPDWAAIQPWPDVPFPVTEAAAGRRLCVVTADPTRHEAIRDRMSELEVVLAAVDLPESPFVGLPGRSGSRLLFEATRFEPDSPPVPAQTFVVARNMALIALAGVPGVTEVEWSYGVTGPRSAYRARDFEQMDYDDAEPPL